VRGLLRGRPLLRKQGITVLQRLRRAALCRSVPVMPCCQAVTRHRCHTVRCPAGNDDMLSGWAVNDIKLVRYNYSLCRMTLHHANGASAPTDPSPLVPGYLYSEMRNGNVGACSAAIKSQPDPHMSVYYRSSLVPGIEGEPIEVSGLNVIIHVTRFSAPAIITGERCQGRLWFLPAPCCEPTYPP
jgi:hypothetical protein